MNGNIRRIADANGRAFTLVELLVVIAIIALLISILAPSMGKVKELARNAVCKTHLRAFGLGMATYTTIYRGVLPWEGVADGDRQTAPVGPWDHTSFWANAIPTLTSDQPYYELQQHGHPPKAGDQNLFVCPSVSEVAAGPGDTVKDGYFMMWGGKEGTPEPYLGNSNQVQRPVFWSYVWNSKLDNAKGSVKVDALPTSEVPVLVEKMMNPNELDPSDPDYGSQSLGRSKTADTRFTARHDGGGSLLFIDGHVEQFPRKFIKTQDAQGRFNKPGQILWNPYGNY